MYQFVFPRVGTILVFWTNELMVLPSLPVQILRLYYKHYSGFPIATFINRSLKDWESLLIVFWSQRTCLIFKNDHTIWLFVLFKFHSTQNANDNETASLLKVKNLRDLLIPSTFKAWIQLHISLTPIDDICVKGCNTSSGLKNELLPSPPNAASIFHLRLDWVLIQPYYGF